MALKVEEIRIGNMFLGYDDKPFAWSLNEFVLLSQGVEIDEIIKAPIQLTEDWLLKFGFGKCEEHSLSKEIDDRIMVIYDWHFEHVHELQNFWYFLAGQELTA